MGKLTRARSILVLQHLGRKLEEILPTHRVFLAARAAIVREGTCPDLKKLLSIESELYQERSSLKTQILTVHSNNNKMEFVTARARLEVVDKKLKETIKQLNHRLLKSEVVKQNFDKLLEEFGWLKQRINANEIESLWNQTNEESSLSTTIQKQESILVQENLLVLQIIEMKKETQEIERRERDLEVSNKIIESTTLDLVELQDGKNPHLLSRKRNVAVKRNSTHRLYSFDEDMLKKEIKNSMDQMKKEEDSHQNAMKFLKNEARLYEEEICHIQEGIERKNLRLVDLITNAESRRERNLTVVLQLQVKCQQHEEEIRIVGIEKKRREQAEEQEQRLKEAVKLIQNRLALLYRSKFKKKSITKTTVRKGMNKRKKK